MDPIQFHNIKAPSDLTVWYTDDSEGDHSLVSCLEEALPQGVKFELAHHPEELREKLHAKGNNLTKYNFFISDGAMEFSKTKWSGKPESTNVRDHYWGSFDVIKGYEPQLLGKGGHYFTALYSSAFRDNPVRFDTSSSTDEFNGEFKLDVSNASTTYNDFKSRPDGVMILNKDYDGDPAERFTSMIQHFDKLIGLAA